MTWNACRKTVAELILLNPFLNPIDDKAAGNLPGKDGIMIDHMGISARDFEISRRFYDAALAPLGVALMMEVTSEESGGYHGAGYGKDGKPFFWLSNDVHHVATDGARGTGVHIAFSAQNRAAVDAWYAAAMAHGGRDNGPPGVRAHYHPAYYAAFVIDPDGFNVEAVCHTPE